MKRCINIFIILLLALTLSACGAEQETQPEATKAPVATLTPTPTATEAPTPTPFAYVTLDNVTDITLPESSDRLSFTLAKQLLALCTGHTEQKTREAFEQAGFRVLLQKNFDKEAASREHTSAFTIGVKYTQVNDKLTPIVLVAVRGTNAGEWYSNFDIMPSRNLDSMYAENFLYTAEDALLSVSGIVTKLSADEQANAPLLVICGHSRGAATANLLGVLLDELYPSENVYVYTYATPATVRGDFGKNPDGTTKEYGNIFNFINPCDLVPEMPLAKWGYRRAGQDIILPVDKEIRKQIVRTVATLEDLAPTPDSYYNTPHRISKSFISMDITTYQLMQMIAGVLAMGSNAGETTESDNTFLPDTTQIQNSLNLGNVFNGTDFEALFNLFDASEDGITSSMVLEGHMPARYLELIEKMEMEK